MTLPTTRNTPNPRGRGFGASVDELLLRLAVGPGRRLTIEPAPLQADRVNTAENPSEYVSDFGDVFGRDAFSGGEGLRYAHRRDRPEGATARFWASRDVDVSDPPDRKSGGIRLLPETERYWQWGAHLNHAMAVAGSSLYIGYSTSVRRIDDPAGEIVLTALDPHAGETEEFIQGIAALGTDVYVALGVNGIHRDTGAGFTHYSDVEADGVWAVENRIIASSGTDLFEITAAGAAPTPLRSLQPGEVWTDVADGESAILATATDGYVYAFAPDETGVFGLRAQSRIPGEQPTSIVGAQGFVFYGTSQPVANGVIGRLWRARLNGDLVLSDRQLIRQWGDADAAYDHTPHALLASRDEVYAGVRENEEEAFLWRYDLATAGLVRSLRIYTAGSTPDFVASLAQVGGKLFAAVAGSGFYRTADTLASVGWLMGPLGDFFTTEDKSWVSGRIDTSLLGGGQRVELYYATDEAALDDPDSASWVRVKRLSSGVDTLESSLGNVTGRHLAGMVKLYPDDTRSTSPVVQAFSFRAYPGPGDWIVNLPVNVSDHISAPNRRYLHVRGRGEELLDALLNRQGEQAVLHLFKPERRLRGLIEAVGVPADAIPKRGSVPAYAMVRFRGRETTLSGPVDPQAMGVGLMGVTEMGGVA